MIEMLLEAVVLGILQGVLEWLPVSSRGNLVLAMMHLFGVGAAEALKLSVFLHTGTLLAAAVYFRREIAALLRALPRYRLNYADRENSLTSFLLFSTVLTGAVGYPLFRLALEATVVGEAFTALVGVALIATGLLQRSARKTGGRGSADPGPRDTLLVGVAQGFSAFPGISRSGVTTSLLLLRGFSGTEALRLSFLMSVPSVLVAEVGLGLTRGLPAVGTQDLLLGALSSFALGMLSIHVLVRAAERVRFWKFCLLLGVLAVLPTLYYLH